ncbi:hypothetical protein [Candidatus Poriferisocius sp.]|uniref:hypothetical protein n=1 Tax=Candidatus Poriferisocius sp. TaxID=3101276 RepID=UPI003B591846
MGLLVPDALPADPLAALRTLAESEAEFDELRRAQVAAARDSGASWEQIGQALGTSRQAAWEHFAKRANDTLAALADASSDLSEDEAMALAVKETKAVRRQRRH